MTVEHISAGRFDMLHCRGRDDHNLTVSGANRTNFVDTNGAARCPFVFVGRVVFPMASAISHVSDKLV